MIHSEGSQRDDDFSPKSQSLEEKAQDKNKSGEQKKYQIIDQSIRVALLRRILSKESTIKEAAKEFGLNFSTAKAILQTYRKEGRIGKKKNRERKDKAKVKAEGTNSTERKVQSMYDLERDGPINLQSQQNLVDTAAFQNQQIAQQQLQLLTQQRMIMSTPNLDDNSTQIALAYYQRELNRQKLLNLQLMVLLQNLQSNQSLPSFQQTAQQFELPTQK